MYWKKQEKSFLAYYRMILLKNHGLGEIIFYSIKVLKKYSNLFCRWLQPTDRN